MTASVPRGASSTVGNQPLPAETRKTLAFFGVCGHPAGGTDGAKTPVMTPGTGRRFGRDSGYTLVELVAVVAIVAVSSALAYPALAGLRRGQELECAAVGLTQKLRLAHWRAVASGGRVRVTPRLAADGLWRFRMERERGTAWEPDGEELPIPRNTVVALAGAAEKVFNPDGTCSLGSITLRGAGGEVYRCTLTPATGRVRLYRGDREAGRGL